jgi:endonuclease/exonuclease/phosphatase family metal-dependent hydrolase
MTRASGRGVCLDGTGWELSHVRPAGCCARVTPHGSGAAAALYPRRLPLRVLTWNLFHGRALPPAGRDLLAEFSARLAAWPWDVAVLQEVPPWWAPDLARAANAVPAIALTSRNALLPVRRALARRWPDALKSNGGGSNAILARVRVEEVRAVRLRTRPERRVAQLARLEGGTCVANYHASTTPPRAAAELARLWELALDFAAGAAVVLAGDLNLRAPVAPAGAVHAAARDVDHVFAHKLRVCRPATLLDRSLPCGAELSDHPPLLVQLSADAVLPPAPRVVGTL